MAAAHGTLRRYRVAVFIVAYNAERVIQRVLERIPVELRHEFTQIYIIDDHSPDSTFDAATRAGHQLGLTNVLVLRTPFKRGYGGNQKLGYVHAIKSGFDFVVLLHGDGAYAPECLPRMLAALADGNVDVVLASRMINPRMALAGGMPLYKWLGNQLVSTLQNLALGTSLSEFHSGYRAYRVGALRSIKFHLNTNELHFDTEVLIQMLATDGRVREVPIPNYLSDEIGYASGVRYALNCLKAVAKFHLTRLGLFYEPSFDFQLFEKRAYYLKTASNSLHQFILRRRWVPSWSVVDLGANDGELSAAIAERVQHVTSVDVRLPGEAGKAEARAIDLNSAFDQELGQDRYDCVVALDVVEHLVRPEDSVGRIFRITRPGGLLYASTANIAFLPLRLSLLAGQFNYGKRGILDLTHSRLFTIYSFRKLLEQSGFAVKELHYFGPPIRDMIGESGVLRLLDSLASLLAQAWPTVFAYNFLVVAERTDNLEEMYLRTAESQRQT